MTENEIAKLIVNAAYQVHVELGPGLLESAYEACLIYELVNAGLQVSNCNYRIDIWLKEK